MAILINKQAALDAIQARADMELADINHNYLMGLQEAAEAVESVPDAQPGLDEWCTDCKEYDHEKHHCPRWNRVIREALKDAQPEERTNERTETHACDSISRQAAMIVIENSGLDDDSKDTVVRVLEQLPSAQPEPKEDCDTCKHGYFGDSQCNNCRVRFPSHYEREEEYHGSD